MIARIRKDDPESRARLLSHILDPEYAGSPRMVGSLRASLPQPSVFVDHWGDQHDPDFRLFGSHPVITPLDEPRAWPWNDDDDDDEPLSITGPTSLRSGRRSHSNTSSSYRSSFSSGSGTRSRSASVLPSPPSESDHESGQRRISPPAHIPRSALFPWTPAQRAARVQYETNKRYVPPPPVFLDEEDETAGAPLSLVDSRYVPGYGHFTAPPQTAPTDRKDEGKKYFSRARAHTAPSSSSPLPAEDTEEDEIEPPKSYVSGIARSDPPELTYSFSPASVCSHSLRQSVYSFGLRTKLGLHHMKDRMRRASNAAKRPLSL
jgi:hypothetical protein